MPIVMGKSRDADKPYLIVEDKAHGFTYKVLRAYSNDPNKAGARWFLATASPYTYGSDEYGDGYTADVTGVITFRDPEVPDSAIPAHLLDPSLPKPKSIMEQMGF